MTIEFSDEVKSDILKIKYKNKTLYNKLEKQLRLFTMDSRYPSLRIHKLKGTMEETWSMSIDNSYRLIYIPEDNGIFVVGIGTHEQVYQK